MEGDKMIAMTMVKKAVQAGFTLIDVDGGAWPIIGCWRHLRFRSIGITPYVPD